MLTAEHGHKVVLLIDEYDNAVNEAESDELRKRILGFMSNFLSSALKDSSSLDFAVVTGVMQIAKASIFSGLNNLYVNSQLGCIAPAVAYIAENYMEEISVEKLSYLCHVSTSHFRRLFKQVLGWSPLDYIQIVRIDRACVLLYNCDYSITDIGLQVGYPSSSSFNRQFRRIHGISPSQWRQKIRSEENPIVTAYFNSLPPSNFQFFPTEYHDFTE